jgi:hypothetical protein
LICMKYELRATVNGKALSRPISSTGFIPANKTTRLIVRVEDVALRPDLLAAMKYDVSYYFERNERRARRTSKGIEWRSQVPQGQPGPTGGSVVKPVNVTFFDEVEE